MIDNLEDSNFDYIILGTGLIESVLAGSLARAGRKVLHLDSHSNYGGNWSVFGFRELVQWYLKLLNQKEFHATTAEGDMSIDYQKSYLANFRNIQLILNGEASTKEDIATEQEPYQKLKLQSDQALFNEFFSNVNEENRTDHLAEMRLFVDLLQKSRSYNFDTTPKLLGTRENLVEILIRSGVGRYLEFKNVDEIYLMDRHSEYLEKVPSSKEDVFTNKSVSLIEKRKLMKFLTFAMDYSEAVDDTVNALLQDTEAMNFDSFLEERFKLTGKLKDAIVYAIALVDAQASVKVGLEKTHQFVKSMGRFGKGAYLCPLYGGGSEIAQAFCRVCAVYGGVYILDQPLDRYVMDRDAKLCKGIITKEGQVYHCEKLIAGIDYLNKTWLPDKEDFGTWIARAIILTDKQLGPKPTEEQANDILAYSVIPPGSLAGNSDAPIYIIHQNEESMTCPSGQYVTYFWTVSKEKDVLQKAVAMLLTKDNDQASNDNNAAQKNDLFDTKPMFGLYFDQFVRSIGEFKDQWKLPGNIIPCSDPDVTLSFATAIEEAYQTFLQCEPSDDITFMPASERDPVEDDL